MSSCYGENLKLSIFGQSHSGGIGMVLDGIPAGLPVDMTALQSFLNRRAPGHGSLSTPRKEADIPEFLGGISKGFTCGAPIAAVIGNHNTRSADYDNLKFRPRPGHADYTAQIKYFGYQDEAGGGHFSGRLTAPLCIAGGLCKQWLKAEGIEIGSHILAIANIRDEAMDPVDPNFIIDTAFPVYDPEASAKMQACIADAKTKGDSVGGIVECGVTGLPAGLGDPMFFGMESRLSSILYGIPAVKAVEFGDGMTCSQLYGSQNNDAYIMKDGAVKTLTNHCGGILGGITNGMPIIFRCGIKPTPSIALQQQSIDLASGENTSLQIHGRHDPCIVPRAVPVVEAAAAIAIFDALLARRREFGR